ncbi:type II toxin-antitoxin system VapC family toxin [Spirosoma koreense]
MADTILMVDTSLLIDYFRKSDKSKTRLVRLSEQFERLAIASITEFEIYSGATQAQLNFWNELLSEIIVCSFDSKAARIAVDVKQTLKKQRKSIDIADLFIASTAIANDLPLDTLNRKHFELIEQLRLLPEFG